MVWTGTGDVIDPNSPDAVKKEIVNLVVPELVRQRLIAPESP
jgi:hypothetical protein